MANKIKNVYNGLPPWGKGVVATGGVLIVLYIVYNAYRMSKTSSDAKEANKVTDTANRELADLNARGIRPSYTKTQYETFSLKLAEAMNDCGTNEDSIMQVFQAMKNKADVLALISAFGVRYYQPCAASQPISYARYLWNDKLFGGNLQTWLEYDLSAGNIKDINDLLAQKNIDFQF